jgi:two-component system cell cycle sensor histidine kinase/response regulator CckA
MSVMTSDEFQILVNNLPLSVFRLNSDRTISFVNRPLCEFLDLPLESLTGRRVEDVCRHPEMLADWQSAIEESFATRKPSYRQFVYEKDGAPDFTEVHFIPHLESEAVTSITGALLNTTALHRVKAALGRHEKLFQQYMDHNPLIAWLRSEAGVYVYANQMYLSQFGLAPDELIGKSIFDRWPKEIAETFMENDRNVLETGNSIQVLERAPDPDGRERDWLITKFPFTDSNDIRYVGGIGVDLTERINAEQEKERLEQQLKKWERLDSLGAMAGGAAHDINNLLAVVLGNLALARPTVPGGVPAHKFLDQAEQAGQRIAELCRQMLAFAGKGPFVPRSLSLNDLIREVVDLFASRFTITFRAGAIPSISGDMTQIRQVVLNLVTNAGDAIRNTTGTVTVETNIVTPAAHESFPPDSRVVRLTVTDTGAGMSDTTRERIFEPFFTTKTGGHGLGLATVLGIVRRHKGTIHVESILGKGTTFEVLFPFSAQ